MSAIRTYTTIPNSINSTLAAARFPRNMTSNGQPQRSEEAAKEATQSFAKDEKEPLAAHQNPQSKPGITYAAQEKLPKLPIPDLESSCKKYLEALRPLLSSKEHENTERAVQDFLRGEGPELQDRLKKYAADKPSYIEQFWYDSYLSYDNPVVLNLNPFFLLEDDPTPARNNQVTRAASLVISSLSFVRAVRKEELPPDTVRGQPLCMYQYSRLFGTARIPTENGCQIVQDPTAKHVVVMCQGQFYWFDVLDDNSDLIMSEKDVALNLQAVVEDAAEVSIQEAARGAVGVLSTENRKIWSGLRDVLHREERSNNSDCLNIVDSALFVLCLDYTEPQTGAELCMNMLCGSSKVERGVQTGTCTNRWYDKLQIIVCKNGSAGINFEHTGVDGHTVLRFASDVYTDTILRYARTINGQAPSLWASTSPDPAKRDPSSFGDVTTTPRKLEWDMVPELSTALRFAETRLADLIQQNEFETLEFGNYGKNFMTSMGFSPDAFVQMAFQAAYYGLYGRIECVYEPAMTKAFFHGRTEAVRSVTSESVEFVRTFWADHPPEKKIEALRRAAKKHTAITKESAAAQGHDRHLYALMCIWQRNHDEDFMDGASSIGMDESTRASSPVSYDGAPGGTTTTSAMGSPGRPRLSSSASSRRSTSPQHGPHQQLPALFNDGGWDKVNTTVLSTSNCGNPSLRQFGFGPTSGDGFGIGYIIKDGSISICASSKHRQTSRFIDAIESYFLEIRRLLRQTGATVTAGHLGRAGIQALQDKSASRAREAERREMEADGAGRPGGMKSRGRAILPDTKVQTPMSESYMESEDEGLGGYGFFDAGMLASALKNKNPHSQRANEKDSGKKHVGRKLRLAEY